MSINHLIQRKTEKFLEDLDEAQILLERLASFNTQEVPLENENKEEIISKLKELVDRIPKSPAEVDLNQGDLNLLNHNNPCDPFFKIMESSTQYYYDAIAPLHGLFKDGKLKESHIHDVWKRVMISIHAIKKIKDSSNYGTKGVQDILNDTPASIDTKKFFN